MTLLSAAKAISPKLDIQELVSKAVLSKVGLLGIQIAG